MCLRYALAVTDARALIRRFDFLQSVPDLRPRYNIAPTQQVPVIFNDDSGAVSLAHWGMTAVWHGAEGGKMLLLNARAESIDHKPSFRADFSARRCLMLADSFYEWKQPEKRPFRVSMKGGGIFAFAGIYADTCASRSVCMITTEANQLVGKIHDRMPAILPEGAEKGWLGMDAPEAKSLLQPYPAERMDMYEVSKKLNSARIDSPELAKPKSGKETLADWMG